jgi:hypothetical protein
MQSGRAGIFLDGGRYATPYLPVYSVPILMTRTSCKTQPERAPLREQVHRAVQAFRSRRTVQEVQP